MANAPVEHPRAPEPSHQVDTDQTEAICTTGNLFLVVGKQKLRFRVHSQCLQLASPVFHTKFLSLWSGGKSPSEDSPKDIGLGDDDGSAMWRICCVLHHRNDLVPLELPAEEVLQIAVVSSKYNLSCALKHIQEAWLTKAVDTNTMRGAARLLAAAQLFRNAPSYSR